MSNLEKLKQGITVMKEEVSSIKEDIKELSELLTIKTYRSDYEGKAQFVKEILSPLLIQADTGWYGAEYELIIDEETKYITTESVHLLSEGGFRCKEINVHADSIEAMVRDVFKNL